MNQFSVKLASVFLVGLLAVTGLLCLIGFTLGGRPTWLHYAIFLVLSAALGSGSAVFIFHTPGYREKLTKTALLLSIGIFFLAFCLGYGRLNKLSAGNEVTEYPSVVTGVYCPAKSLRDEVYFTDRSGEEQYVNHYAFTHDYAEGDEILVRERTGGFGYSVYEIRLTRRHPENHPD